MGDILFHNEIDVATMPLLTELSAVLPRRRRRTEENRETLGVKRWS